MLQRLVMRATIVPMQAGADVVSSTESALRELILAIEAFRSRGAASLSLSVTDSQAVSYLIARGPLGQRELADALSLTTGSVTVLVDRLEARGIVQRTPHPSDRRRTVVRLADSARDRLDPVRERLGHALEGFSRDEQQAVTPLLLRLVALLREAADSPPAEPPATPA